jgi:ferredoxin
MEKNKNIVFGISFFFVLVAMVIFNSCGKYDNTYSVDNTKCSLCMECISICGQHAISVNGSGTSEYITINTDKCIGCGKCYNACSYRAISSN